MTPNDSTGSPSTSAMPGDSTVGTSGNAGTGNGGSTTGDVCPPIPPDGGGYDACPSLCGGGGQCFNDGMDYAVCTRGCFMDCDCWAAPNSGNAPVRCNDQLLETTSLCVLDCSSGQTCPDSMFCVNDLGICAHEYPEAEDSSSGDMESTGSSSSSGMESTGSSSGGMGSTGSSSSSGLGSTGSSGTGGVESTGSSSSSGMESTGSSDTGGMESTGSSSSSGMGSTG